MTEKAQIASSLRAWHGAQAGISICNINQRAADNLFPEENSYVSSAIPKRRAEFAAGRWCARQALRQIGVSPQPILVGPLSAPVWPPGVVGTISHDGGLCLAAVQPIAICAGVGADLFDRSRYFSPHAATMMFSQKEVRQARSLGGMVDSFSLLFSMKESVVKAVSARVGEFIDMMEIQVVVGNGTFLAHHTAARDIFVSGRWMQTPSFFLTMALLLK